MVQFFMVLDPFKFFKIRITINFSKFHESFALKMIKKFFAFFSHVFQFFFFEFFFFGINETFFEFEYGLLEGC